MMSWSVWITKVSKQLEQAGVEAANSEAKRIVEFVCEKKSLLLADPPTTNAILKLQSLVEARTKRIPLQHLIGKMYFRYLELVSSPAALIVRPETEGIVDLFIEFSLEQSKSNPYVADWGTGSGALALSLGYEFPHLYIDAVDISTDALILASRNLQTYPQLSERVNLQLADARYFSHRMQAMPQFAAEFYEHDLNAEKVFGYSAILTNPPYVDPEEQITQTEALADPSIALYGSGYIGANICKEMLDSAFRCLSKDGYCFMEHAEKQAEYLRDYALSCGFSRAESRYDLAGRLRYLVAKK